MFLVFSLLGAKKWSKQVSRSVFYFQLMFVRKKKNKSGIISVQVIDKSTGKYKVIKTIGSSANIQQINWFVLQGKSYIKQHRGQIEIDFSRANELFSKFISGIKQVNVVGGELLLGKIF